MAAAMGKSKFLLNKSKERFRGRARSLRRSNNTETNNLMPMAREGNPESRSNASASQFQNEQQQPNISNQHHHLNDQMYYENQPQYDQQPQMLQYPPQPPELQYLQNLQYVRQDEIQLQQWNQAQEEQLRRQGGMGGGDDLSLAYSHQTHGRQSVLAGNLVPIDEHSLQQLIQRQQYEHEQKQMLMSQEQMRQQEQLRWQHQQLHGQQGQLRHREQARQKQELQNHQQQMRQQQQIRNQKMQHQQRHQNQMHQQQLREQQQLLEQEVRREHMKQYEQQTHQRETQELQQKELMQQMIEEEEKLKEKERPIKVRKGCWKRQQRLLDMQDDGESVHYLEAAIARPTSKRNLEAATLKDLGAVEDSLIDQGGVTLNADSISDALTLLSIASRLKIPEHLAETLIAYSCVPQGSKKQFVRQAIATRQDGKYRPEDFSTVNPSISLNTHTFGNADIIVSDSGRGQEQDAIPSSIQGPLSSKKSKQKQKGARKSSDPTSIQSSLSVEPNSTLTSRRDTYDDSIYVATSTFSSKNKSSSRKNGKSTEYSAGKHDKYKMKQKDEVDGMSANLKGLSASTSDESATEDVSDVALSPQHTNISKKESDVIELQKSSSSRSQKHSKQSHSSSSRSKRRQKKLDTPYKEQSVALEGTTTSLSALEINPVSSGQASVGLSAMSNPSTFAHTRAGSETDRSYPSLKPTDAFTVTSRKMKTSSRAISRRRRHSPSPSTVFMSYTLSDNEESETSVQRNTKLYGSMSGMVSMKSRRSVSIKSGSEPSNRTGRSQRDSVSSHRSLQKDSKIMVEDYDSYATSKDPIESAESRRMYDKTFSGSGSTDLAPRSSGIVLTFEGDPRSEDNFTAQSAPSERFASDFRPSRSEEYPDDAPYDLSGPFSSEYEDTISSGESEVREKPSSPRRHPAMEDYEASNLMLREEEESKFSSEHSSYRKSMTRNSRRPSKKESDILFSNQNSIEAYQKVDLENVHRGSVIESTYSTMAKVLRKEDKKHTKRRLVSSKSRKNKLDVAKYHPPTMGCGIQFEKKTEEEEDLDQWLESAMASKSFDGGCTLDARHLAEDDGDLDAWLDNVICR